MTVPPVGRPGYRCGVKHKSWLAVAAGLVLVFILGYLAFQQARGFEDLARAGKADASTGLRSLQAERLPEALAAFQQAKDEFRRAKGLLGPESLRGLPWIGKQLGVADDLATIGLEGSSAGAEVVELLTKARAASGDNRVGQVLELAHPHLDAALVSLVTVAQRAETLSADGLVPQLSSAVTELHGQLEPLRPVLQRSGSMLELERYLFSGQHRFLIVTQNGAELRPAGGFMGTYGLVEFGPEGFHLTKYVDMDTLPRDSLNLPLPTGGQVNYRHFYFRNSNWWMDFPTSAEVMMRFWQNLQQPRVDGIIAIDIPTIRDLLKIFGPITVPESREPLTAQNVMEQLTYIVEYQYGLAKGDKKNAVVSLAAELLRRVTNLGNEQILPTLASLGASANEKHVQLFFTDAEAQAAVVGVGWSGALAPPLDTTDLLAVSNGVIKPSKANIGVTKTLDYNVSLAADGSGETTLRLGYRKSPKLLLGVPQQWLANYVRAHRSPGTTQPAGNPAAFDALDDATDLPTFGHYFRLEPGASTVVVLSSRVPHALRPSLAGGIPGSPVPPVGEGAGDAWHYRLLAAKQADLLDTSAVISVTVPEGWRVTGSAAWFRVSGSEVRTVNDGGMVRVATPLRQDLLLDVTVTRG